MNGKHVFGARYYPDKTVFTLWAPYSVSVMLQLYSTGSEEEGGTMLSCTRMERGPESLFTLTVPGDLHGVYYNFQLTFENGRQTISADPWATACGVNGARSMVVDLRRTDPEGWEWDRHLPAADFAPVVWETHVCDFSLDPACGVRPEWRGKYLGFTEPEPHLRGSRKRPVGLRYLKELGVTHIQLQPIADYFTVDERTGKGYNWGYDIENYNVPEGSYSTDPFHGEVRIRECKQMIQAIHQAGLRVVLDVVYNHTYHKDSWLHRTAPGQYYRHAPDGSFMNASGCGTETASERWPFRNYMIQSVLYWAREYHVDGFRFDLMAIHDAETMNLLRAELDKLPGGEDILLYGEPWAGGQVALAYPSVPANREALREMDSRIGIFSDNTRNMLVGESFRIDECGYASGKTPLWMERHVQSMLCGWCRTDLEHFAKAPSQIVHYVSCHDNFTLWDRLVASTGSRDFDAANSLALRRNRLASALVLLSLGISFFQSGEEFCRTKHGNGNTYNGPARENRLAWQSTVLHEDLVSWYRGLIRIRRELYPAVSRAAAEELYFQDAPEMCVAFTSRCRAGSPWEEIYVAVNPGWDTARLDLPGGTWQIICDGEDSALDTKETRTVSGRLEAAPVSVLVLAKKDGCER